MKKALKHFIILLLMTLFSSSVFAEETTKKEDEELWTGVDKIGVSVLPKAFVQYCKISQDDVAELTPVVKCVDEILDLKEDDAQDAQQAAQELGEQILRQSSTTINAEGLAQKQKTFYYPTHVLSRIEKDVANATDAKELLSALMIIEKESAHLDNKILMLKSSEMQFDSFSYFNMLKGHY